MYRNGIQEQVGKIEDMELKLTIFNAKRALAKIDKQLEVRTIGKCHLLIDNTSNSIYYNRIKGFGKDDLDKLDDILSVYREQNITPCFDMTPNNMNEEISLALLKQGFMNVEQLVFMQSVPQAHDDISKEIKIVRVTEENAEEFVNIILLSNGGMKLPDEVIARKKAYFYQDNFHNYIAYIGAKVAGIGSMFLSGNEGYIANDFTFEEFRGMGSQTALLKYRIHKAKELGLELLYTDVEFGSISHNNMERIGFRTAFINSFYMKLI